MIEDDLVEISAAAAADADPSDYGSKDILLNGFGINGRAGSSEVVLRVVDLVNGNIVGENTARFNVEINDATVIHQGWNHIKAVGARVGGSPYCEPSRPLVADRFNAQVGSVNKDTCSGELGIWREGKVLDNPKVCSFSETLCDWNGSDPSKKRRCFGNGSPSSLGVVPLEYNALFANVSNNNDTSCYRARGTVDLGNSGITLKAKRAGAIFLEIVSGDSTELEMVNHTAGGFYYDLNPAYSYARLKIGEGATYEDIKDRLVYGGGDNEHGSCDGSDPVLASARCFLEVSLPELEDRVEEKKSRKI